VFPTNARSHLFGSLSMGGNRTSVPRSAIAAKGEASASVAERDAAKNDLFIVLAVSGRVALLDSSSSSVSFLLLRTFVAPHKAVDVDFMRRCCCFELLLLRLILLIAVVIEKDDVKEEEEANMVLLCVSDKACLRVSSGALFNGRFWCLR